MEAFKIEHNILCEPEVVISYKCNLDICSYCYARNQKQSTDLSPEKFDLLISWFCEIYPDFAGITLLGGEPTFLDNLKQYIYVAKEHNIYVNLFTNGNFNECQLNLLIDSQNVKIIYFHLEQQHINKIENHLEIFEENIKKLKDRNKDIRLRVNFDGIDFDYELAIKLATKYSLPIYWSITSPCKGFDGYIDKKRLHLVGTRLEGFFSKSKKNGLEIQLLRPIPQCAFTPETIEEFGNYADITRKCNISTYVYPDLSVQFCTVMDHTRYSTNKVGTRFEKYHQ